METAGDDDREPAGESNGVDDDLALLLKPSAAKSVSPSSWPDIFLRVRGRKEEIGVVEEERELLTLSWKFIVVAVVMVIGLAYSSERAAEARG